jgi:hypothetical protein
MSAQLSQTRTAVGPVASAKTQQRLASEAVPTHDDTAAPQLRPCRPEWLALIGPAATSNTHKTEPKRARGACAYGSARARGAPLEAHPRRSAVEQVFGQASDKCSTVPVARGPSKSTRAQARPIAAKLAWARLAPSLGQI